MSRAVRVVHITRHTALVRGVPAEEMRALGVERRAWCDPILCWAVPIAAVSAITAWAHRTGQRVEVSYAEVDR